MLTMEAFQRMTASPDYGVMTAEALIEMAGGVDKLCEAYFAGQMDLQLQVFASVACHGILSLHLLADQSTSLAQLLEVVTGIDSRLQPTK